MDVKTYALTGDQMYMYSAQVKGMGKAVLLGGSIVVKGSRSVEELQHALNEVMRINDGLRMRVITDENGSPVQFVAPFEERTFEVMEFSSAEELDSYGGKWCDIPFELGADNDLVAAQIVLLPDSYGVILRIHHMISDAWTILLIGNQLMKILDGEIPKAYPYTEYLEERVKYKDTVRYQKDLKFFREQQAKYPKKTHLSPEPILTGKRHCREFTVSGGDEAMLREYASSHQTTETNLFAVALAAWMSRMLGTDDLYIGAVALNRSGIKEKNTTGMFACGIPVGLSVSPEESFADNLKSVSMYFLSAYRHQKIGSTGVYGHGDMPYDIWLSYQTAALDDGREARIKQYLSSMTGQVMVLEIIDRGDGNITLQLEYNAKYPDRKAERLVKEVPQILIEGIKDDSQDLKTILDKVMKGESCLTKLKKLF